MPSQGVQQSAWNYDKWERIDDDEVNDQATMVHGTAKRAMEAAEMLVLPRDKNVEAAKKVVTARRAMQEAWLSFRQRNVPTGLIDTHRNGWGLFLHELDSYLFSDITCERADLETFEKHMAAREHRSSTVPTSPPPQLPACLTMIGGYDECCTSMAARRQV